MFTVVSPIQPESNFNRTALSSPWTGPPPQEKGLEENSKGKITLTEKTLLNMITHQSSKGAALPLALNPQGIEHN